MAITEAQRRAHDKYFSKAYRQVKLSMPNDEADALDQHCQKFGFTRAGFIRRAIVEAMERDNSQPVGGDRDFILDDALTQVIDGQEYDVFYRKRSMPRYCSESDLLGGGGGGYSAPVSGGVSVKNSDEKKKTVSKAL